MTATLPVLYECLSTVPVYSADVAPILHARSLTLLFAQAVPCTGTALQYSHEYNSTGTGALPVDRSSVE